MVKVLRKFRWESFSKGGFRRYLLYALGEITLLVIGILIALYVNNINQERRERASEIRLYGEILEDLKSDEQLLDFLIEDLKRTQDMHYALWSGKKSDKPLTKIVYHVIYAPVTLANHLNTPTRVTHEKVRNKLNVYLTDLKYGGVAMENLKNEIEKVRKSFVDKGILDVAKVYDTPPYELPDPERVELMDQAKLMQAMDQGLLNAEFLNLKMSTAYAINDLSAIKARNADFQRMLRSVYDEAGI
jgi:hypothetical protein